MTNILSVNKDSFVQKFLQPVSKLADNVSIFVDGKKIYSICASQDGGVVLLASYELDIPLKGVARINLPDIKKFVRLLDTIDQTELVLTIQDNHIKYNTDSIRFNYFLLEDNYMQRCPVNPDKINQLKYDTSFELPTNKLNDIIKGSSITTDSDKLYFFTKDKKVFCELNDYERQNINNIVYLITDDYSGSEIKNTLPLNLENIRLLAGIRSEQITVMVNNDLKVTSFVFKEKGLEIKFIISALVK